MHLHNRIPIFTSINTNLGTPKQETNYTHHFFAAKVKGSSFSQILDDLLLRKVLSKKCIGDRAAVIL